MGAACEEARRPTERRIWRTCPPIRRHDGHAISLLIQLLAIRGELGNCAPRSTPTTVAPLGWLLTSWPGAAT
jgi:hypothetical protein